MVNSQNDLFQIGSRHENRKGPFEVISRVDNTIRIRWDSGLEISSDIETQERIFRNMQRELAEKSTKRGFNAPQWFGEFFNGFRMDDFSQDVTGTHWRSREQFGGTVTKLMNVREPFNSWSIYKRPEVHWASVSRRGLVEAPFQTKFFVRVTEEDFQVTLLGSSPY